MGNTEQTYNGKRAIFIKAEYDETELPGEKAVPARKAKKEKKKKPSGPMSAAGLISFYEDTDAKIVLTPTWILIVSIVFVGIVLALRTALPSP